MSRISNVIVKQREDFVKGLFRQDPPYTIADANRCLALQVEFGMNKKMALKRIYELRDDVRNESKVGPAAPVVVSPMTPEAVVAINNYMSDAVDNGAFIPVVIGEPVSTMNDNNSPIDLLAATA
jgi:hypothetical protein